MKRRTVLDHDLAEGAMTAWFDGLRTGRVMASCCDTCGRVSCPPVRHCGCGGGVTEHPLTGRAVIVARTTGADGDVALVRMKGADTLTLARLDGFAGQMHGIVRASPDAALTLVPEAPA
jgi:uncharacterized OB-fold protein